MQAATILFALILIVNYSIFNVGEQKMHRVHIGTPGIPAILFPILLGPPCLEGGVRLDLQTGTDGRRCRTGEQRRTGERERVELQCSAGA